MIKEKLTMTTTSHYFCPACGAATIAQANFCESCGSALHPASEPLPDHQPKEYYRGLQPMPILVPPDTSSPEKYFADTEVEHASMEQRAEGRQRQQQQQVYYQPATAPRRGLSRRRALALGGAVGLGLFVFGGLLNHQTSHPDQTVHPVHSTIAPPMMKDFNGPQLPASAL